MAKTDTSTTVSSTPSSRSGMPKVMRGWPVMASMPTTPSARPMNRDTKPRTREAPITTATEVNASTVRAKKSAGLSKKASSATTGAANVSARVAMVPATKEPMAAVASAAAPRPERAILLPSSAVIMEPASPGVLIRMDVVDPPYMAPYSTPANMMKADTGPTDTVTGSSKAMVSAGPMPGNMPMAVPSIDPIRAHSKLVGVSATSKPCSNSPSVSITSPPKEESRPDQAPASQITANPGRPARSQRSGRTPGAANQTHAPPA